MKRCTQLALILSLTLPAAAQTWTISNDVIRRTLTFAHASGLVTDQLTDDRTHTNFILHTPSHWNVPQEFSFLCNGKHYSGAGSQFALVRTAETPIPKGKSLTITLRAKDVALEVSAIYTVYSGHAALRKRLVLRNAGNAPLQISHLDIESISLSVGPENETTLNTQYGAIPREIFYTGRSEDAALLVASARTGIGFAVLSEVPGYMKRTEIDGWDEPDRVPIAVLYDTDLMPFERALAPGEEFQTAAVSLLTFRNGDGFLDPHWELPSYTAKILMRRVDDQGAPWIYNTWEPFERGIDRETVLQLLNVASTMGMDIFTIDDGWQQEYGANDVNLAAFPGGLKPIQEAIEAKGMRLGLWIPLAAIGSTTNDYRKHPEWAALDQQGKEKFTNTAAGPKVVMCLASPFRDAAADRVIDAIERFHLAYVKLDLTTIFNAYGEAPGCWAKGHTHGNWSQSLNAIYEGIAHITHRVYEKHPEVLLDLTFELWGQKHVIDAGLLAAGDLDWISNVDDVKPASAGPRQARTLLYQRAISMPVESMLLGNIHGELPSIQESFATEIGSAPLLLGDLRNLTAADQQWYREKIAWFKQLRKTAKLSESFFPLGNWRQPTSTAWDGFARMEHTGKGVVALFRNHSAETSAKVELPLMPEGTFRARSVVTHQDLGVFTQTEWAHGVEIHFPKNEPVEILELSPANPTN